MAAFRTSLLTPWRPWGKWREVVKVRRHAISCVATPHVPSSFAFSFHLTHCCYDNPLTAFVPLAVIFTLCLLSRSFVLVFFFLHSVFSLTSTLRAVHRHLCALTNHLTCLFAFLFGRQKLHWWKLTCKVYRFVWACGTCECERLSMPKTTQWCLVFVWITAIQSQRSELIFPLLTVRDITSAWLEFPTIPVFWLINCMLCALFLKTRSYNSILHWWIISQPFLHASC